MQIAHDITDSEREAVKRHLISKKDRLSSKVIDKMLSKYEVSLQNKSKQITHLKMDVDDRDIAVDLFFRKKLKTEDIKAEVEVIYQTVEGLHKACPDHLGDWYFTGDYPTPGGQRVVNQAYINFYEGNSKRAY